MALRAGSSSAPARSRRIPVAWSATAQIGGQGRAGAGDAAPTRSAAPTRCSRRSRTPRPGKNCSILPARWEKRARPLSEGQDREQEDYLKFDIAGKRMRGGRVDGTRPRATPPQGPVFASRNLPRRWPSPTGAPPPKKRRRGRIFIDWLRTSAAPPPLHPVCCAPGRLGRARHAQGRERLFDRRAKKRLGDFRPCLAIRETSSINA